MHIFKPDTLNIIINTIPCVQKSTRWLYIKTRPPLVKKDYAEGRSHERKYIRIYRIYPLITFPFS